MPDPYVMKGVLEGFERASQTLLNVSLKKEELKREKKSDDLNYKIKGLQLEKLEGQMDPQLWAMQNKALKDEIKSKKAIRDWTLSQLGVAEFGAKTQSDKLDSYAKGLVDSDGADGADRDVGFQLGSMEFDLEAGLGGKFPFKQVGPEKRLKREKATEELGRRAKVRQPLDTKVLGPKKGFLGFGGNAETVEFAKSIQTRQDLIDMIQNADALEDRGIDIDQLEDLYEDELLNLASEGYLSEQ